jgi:hypothetical protein
MNVSSPDEQDMKAHCSKIEAERRNRCAKAAMGYGQMPRLGRVGQALA